MFTKEECKNIFSRNYYGQNNCTYSDIVNVCENNIMFFIKQDNQ